MTKKTVLIFLSIFALTRSYGQTDQQLNKSIDSLIAAKLSKISPGCAVLIAKDDNIIYQKAFGIADLELNVPMKSGMVFRIGSLTKQFTAVATLQLIEKRKISLSDSIQKFFADFPAQWYTITIENLLTQTSGIPDYLNLEFNVPNPFRIDFPVSQIIDSLKKLPLEFAPSSKFAYSNSNYFLLGYIIEKVSGQTYAEYLRQNIFIPAGLTHTYYDNPFKIIPNRVKGYEMEDSKYRNADFISMSGFYSAGALMANTEDLYKWFKALLNYQIIKKETVDKAFQPYKLTDGKLSEYGYGWFLRTLEGSKTIEHGGSIFGFRAEEIYLPSEKLFVTGLFNCRQRNNDEQELCYDIARIALGKPLYKEVAPDEKTLADYVGTYELKGNKSRKITVTKEGNGLVISSAGQGTTQILFQSEGKFSIKGVTATGEFIREGGMITKMVIQQNGEYIWNKVSDR